MLELMRYAHRIADLTAGRQDDEYRSAANEALVRALKDCDGRPLEPLIAKYVRNAVRTTMRDERTRRATGGADFSNVPSRSPRPALIEDLIDRLGTDRPLATRFWLDKTPASVLAAERGVHARTIWRILCRIRDRLRAMYEETVCVAGNLYH